MPIETICKGCARKLRVGDEHAGRKARCPHCKTVYDVPAPNEPSSQDAFASSLSGIDSPATDQWRLKNPDGSIYGPVSKSELDGWVREGRVAAEAELQPEGSAGWTAATLLYPALKPDTAAESSPFGAGSASGANPFADESAAAQTTSANPYASSTVAARRAFPGRPHRGGLILTFGILSWVGCVFPCMLVHLGFGIAAWMMGRADLQAIRAGQMDPAGESTTQAGMILGIISVVLTVGAIILYVGFWVTAILAGF